LGLSEIVLVRDQGLSGSPSAVAYWALDEGNGSITNDSGSGGNDGTIDGASWIEGCPLVDNDGDGVLHWQDCDDDDSSIGENDGSSAGCPSTSCLAILQEGYSNGSGSYWIDPNGSGALQVYCDMDDDGGGWTLVSNISGSNQNHWGGTEANNIASSSYPIPFEANQAGRRMSDEQVKSIADENVFRVEFATNAARQGEAEFLFRVFFRYSVPSSFSFNARGGFASPLIWTSHSYPYSWEEDGGGDGYHFGCNDYDYAVFDSHNENCPNIWKSSLFTTNRILFGHTPVNGLLTEPHGGGFSGYMWVR